MTSAKSYEDILNESWDEIPEVQLLPQGSWKLKCRGASFNPPKSEGSNPSAMFVFEAVEPMDDVDQGALDDMGDNYDYSANRVFHRIWIESNADKHTMRKLLLTLGVDVEGLTVQESLKAARNKEVIAYIQQRVFQNNAGQTMTENVAGNFVQVD